MEKLASGKDMLDETEQVLCDSDCSECISHLSVATSKQNSKCKKDMKSDDKTDEEILKIAEFISKECQSIEKPGKIKKYTEEENS